MSLSGLLRDSPAELKSGLQLILNAIVEGLCGVDARGEVTFCNESFLQMTGFPAEEVVGKKLHDLLHHQRIGGWNSAANESLFHSAILNNLPVHVFHDVLRRKNGTSFPAEYWSHPLHQPAGKTAHVVTFQDLTERQRATRKAEDVIRQNVDKYRRLVANVPDVIWTSDEKGKTIYVTPNVEQVFGYTAKQICTTDDAPWAKRIHPDDYERVMAAYNALFSNNQAFDEEYRIRKKDGSWIWIHDRSMRTHEQDGVRYADGVLFDITQRKQAEEELRSKTAFLEAQTNATIDAILVVDENGKTILRNQRFVELFEIPVEMQGETDDRVILQHALSKMRDPQRLLERMMHLYEHPDEIGNDEIQFLDGTVLDRYSSPVIGKNGKYYGRIWAFRDVTERQRTVETLRQLSMAVEQSPVSVVITDPEGNISYVNRKFTQVTGYVPEEVLGRNPRFLNAGQSPREMYENLWRTIKRGEEWRGEFCNKKKNGEPYWESATVTPITNVKGEISHFLAVKQDITHQKIIETQLRQAQKLEAIGQLAAGVAHEINTPTQFVTDNLTFLRDSWQAMQRVLEQYRNVVHSTGPQALSGEIRSSIERAEREADMDFICSETPRAIEQALDGVRRVAKIVRAMKEFSHPDSAEKAAADLNKAIETTITVARNEWKYVAEIETLLDEALPLVVCYLGAVNQVILNLVVNAAHAIKEKIKDGEKGKITVCTKARGEFAEISVTDTGTGIPEAVRSRIFDPFFTTKEVGKGTGQGLSQAHAIVVKKHGGKIWFESKSGQGTTFFVQLPIGEPDAGKPIP